MTWCLRNWWLGRGSEHSGQHLSGTGAVDVAVEFVEVNVVIEVVFVGSSRARSWSTMLRLEGFGKELHWTVGPV